jgi:hypothetical protein
MRLRRTVPTALLALAAALPAAGCGRERLDVPDVSRPAPVAGFTPVARPALGLSFALPTGWTLAEGRAPLVARAGSGTATIAVWRYPRTEPLPDDAEALREARSRLVDAARTRDASFDLVRARSTRVDGARAISVVGDETVAGQRRRGALDPRVLPRDRGRRRRVRVPARLRRRGRQRVPPRRALAAALPPLRLTCPSSPRSRPSGVSSRRSSRAAPSPASTSATRAGAARSPRPSSPRRSSTGRSSGWRAGASTSSPSSPATCSWSCTCG